MSLIVSLVLFKPFLGAGAQFGIFKADPGHGKGPLQPGDYWDFAWSDAGMNDDDKRYIILICPAPRRMNAKFI